IKRGALGQSCHKTRPWCACLLCPPTRTRMAISSAAGCSRRWILPAAALAAQRCRGRCATVAVDGMVFHEPVFVGDEVSCYGELVKTGRTSMTVRIEAWRRHLPSDEARKVTEATFTYVAIGEDRRPRPLPPALGS